MAERSRHQTYRLNRSNRKQPFSFDKKSYKQRHRIENAFCRLKDFRRIATRYDMLARNFLASVMPRRCCRRVNFINLDPSQ